MRVARYRLRLLVDLVCFEEVLVLKLHLSRVRILLVLLRLVDNQVRRNVLVTLYLVSLHIQLVSTGQVSVSVDI